jgi:signal transduction histidine kinase/ActR/RegA family two-component response regulator
MSKDAWEREREALRKLTRVFAEETRGGVLGEALDQLIEAGRAHAGAAFMIGRAPELVAERGTLLRHDEAGHSLLPSDTWRQVVTAAASRAAFLRKPLLVDAAGSTDLAAEHTDQLRRRGWRTLVSIPVKHHRDVLGVLVLLAKDSNFFGASAMTFFEIVTHVLALAIDRDRRTEREQAYRDQLQEAGRMASLGLLIATVVHELRGPINALQLQLAGQQDLVKQGAPSPSPELTELMGDMKIATNHIATLVEQLASISTPDSSPDRLDLAAVAKDALAIAKPDLKRRGIAIKEDYMRKCWVSGRRDSLAQVVLNLVFNAADACDASSHEDPTVTVRTFYDGARIALTVDDTGPGIPETDVHDIFQAFFTTKQRRGGTGLGLKICSDFVTAHHGHIEVVNLPSGGASLRVLLPRLAGPDASSGSRPMARVSTPTGSAPASAPTAARQVLLVDDDELFTRTMKRALKPHDVRTAGTASEAQMLLLDPSYIPDLVICDVGLPGSGGDVLHARIAAARPDIAERFVFVTGGGCTKTEADYLRDSGCPTLLKPVNIDQIMSALAAPHPRISVKPEGLLTLQSDHPNKVDVTNVPTDPPHDEPNGDPDDWG